jgi:hypothetical protein
MGTIVQLKRVRIAFIDNLFEPAQYEGKGDFRHTATFIVAPGSENDKFVQEAILKEAQGAWNKKAESMLEDLRGDKKAFSYWKNKKQKDGPPIFLHITKDPDTGKAKRLTGKEGIIYAGCYVNAKVEMWAQAGKYNGMRCGLLGVQFCDHGDSFGGASRPTDDGFDSVDAEDDLA